MVASHIAAIAYGTRYWFDASFGAVDDGIFGHTNDVSDIFPECILLAPLVGKRMAEPIERDLPIPGGPVLGGTYSFTHSSRLDAGGLE